jgi:hypothetical protein
LDAADPYWLNRIIWFSLKGEGVPYPARAGEAPGQMVDGDDAWENEREDAEEEGDD